MDNQINYNYIDYVLKCYVPELTTQDIKINIDIFREAMLHESTKYTDKDKSYDRLEFLGDAIFHVLVTEYIFIRYENENEGFLTKLRIKIERGESMTELSYILLLDRYVQTFNFKINDHVMEDVFEAFIGAFYLNYGIMYTRQLVVALIEKHKDFAEMIAHDDNYKDLLLRYFHQLKWGHPKYDEEYVGNKYISTVRDPKGKIIGKGSSRFKRKAEQNASKKVLENMGIIVNDEVVTDWMDRIEKIEKVKKSDKKTLPIHNPHNVLITEKIISEILYKYEVPTNKKIKVNNRRFWEAMTHRSYLNRNNSDKKVVVDKKCIPLQKKSNCRLQFLGGGVIHFIIALHLYKKYRTRDEGFLTRLRSKLENKDSLFFLAEKTGISEYVMVSQNIEILYGRTNVNIIGGGFEAFIGALYLELGLKITNDFVLAVLDIELDIDQIAVNETNYKELIYHYFNKNGWGYPVYKLISESGPDHNKMFEVGLCHPDNDEKLLSTGQGSSKRKAEQIASKKAYEKIAK
uniref:RNase III domain-containing protein n=1 Tax=viral metagenome TaxID=1070528 RepID=A0A6C0C6Z7_9ZZZZ